MTLDGGEKTIPKQEQYRKETENKRIEDIEGIRENITPEKLNTDFLEISKKIKEKEIKYNDGKFDIKLEYKRNSITIIKEKEGYISKYNLTKNDGTNEYILTTNNNVLINKDGGVINSDDGSIKNNKERVNNPPTITERSPENNGSEIMRIINNFKKRVKEFDEIEKHKAQTEAKKKIETLEKQNTLAEADDLRNLENEIKYLA